MANNEHSDGIEKAILEGMAANEGYTEGDMLVEWVVVAYVTNPSESTDAYPMFFSNGSIPTYRARGLLHTGLKMIELPENDE